MDLKDFSKINLQTENQQENSSQSTKSDNTNEIITTFLSNFGKISEDELLHQISTIVEKQKQEGTFDEIALKNLLQKISPFLNESQQQKIHNIFGF